MAEIKIVSIKMVKEASLYYQYERITSPKEAEKLIRQFIGNADREMLVLVTLDTKNHPTSISTVSIGSLNSSIVHPREVFKPAILANSASIIIGHNHPSGDPEPSTEDISITKRIKECGEILGIELLDHTIIGFNSYISFREKGLL